MKKCSLVLFIWIKIFQIFSQSAIKYPTKPLIDHSVFGKWPTVSLGSLSPDGRYACYSIWDPIAFNSLAGVKSLDSKWEFTKESSGFKFANNNKIAVFKGPHDSLGILELSNRKVLYVSNVSSFQLPSNGEGKWLAYLINKPSKRMIIRNLETNDEQSSDHVSYYSFNEDGSVLLMAVTDSGENSATKALKWVNLKEGKMTTIWTSENLVTTCGNFVFSKNHPCLAFTVEEKRNEKIIKSILYYKAGMDKAVMLTNGDAGNNLLIDGIDGRGFTANGNRLLIKLKEDSVPQSDPNVVQVDLWSYSDPVLQSKQLKKLERNSYTAVLNIESHRISRLEYDDDRVISYGNNFAIVAKLKGDGPSDEWYWNKSAQSSVYLESLDDGKRTLLNENLSASIASGYWLSPAEKYIIYYNPLRRNYFSYEISSGVHRNITFAINGEWTAYDKRDIALYPHMPIYSASAGWIKGDSAVLLYDQHDIYQVDPSGRVSPVNLTKGIGRTKNIEFRLAMENYNQTFSSGDKLILSAFNRGNKNDGFYSIKIGDGRTLELLTDQPFTYKGTKESERFEPVYPVKARDTGIYLVRRMSAKESPNYFWTSDFKTFKSVTDLHPEKTFNWLTTELISWKTFDGTFSQGILYKPENFDPQKNYPIIFNYYERMSDDLNGFIMPDVSHGDLNIPYFVSNGYLVFTPDIHYKIGHPGNSVLNTILSAVKILAKRPYIDTNHMGLQGHSRGGWETNFIVTHTNVFAAAVSASGFCDYVSMYNSVSSAFGVSRQTAYEMGYQRIGATLWKRPDLFIENSPIFKADKVQTPLLLMNNKEDGDIPFEQGAEFFTALRRLGKKAWMLQYDGEDHIVFDKAAEDFTFRMRQFFDHYLKNEPAPIWLRQGIPAKLKGVDSLR